jgi:plastocyanin
VTYRAAVAVFAAGILAAFALAGPAQANNTRVSISDFQWSNPNPHVDLGESVTWDWIGPDTQHSVTGQAPNATQWDSDPGSVRPHPLGDSFTVRFDDPGTYVFQCRLHTSVRGAVTVSNVPGDPNSDPGPQDPLNLDFEAPTVDEIFFTRDGEHASPGVIGPRGKGIRLSFQISEPASASADYYKIVKRGRKKHRRKVNLFRGYSEWNAHIGINTVLFAAKTPNFHPAPGRYIAFFRAEDKDHNATREFKLRFEIKAKKHKKKRKKKR